MNKKKLFYFFVYSFFYFPSLALSLECEKGEIRFLEKGTQYHVKATYCQMKHENTSYFISKSCENGKCSALKKMVRPIFVENLFSEYGTPQFKVCHALGGKPGIVSFRWKEKWIASDRCVFKKDQSFVEASYLFHRWKDFILER